MSLYGLAFSLFVPSNIMTYRKIFTEHKYNKQIKHKGTENRGKGQEANVRQLFLNQLGCCNSNQHPLPQQCVGAKPHPPQLRVIENGKANPQGNTFWSNQSFGYTSPAVKIT